MALSVSPSFVIHANPVPHLVSRQAVFPGLAALGGGEVLAMFAIGQAFDAADMRMHLCLSTDNGRTWGPPVPMHAGDGPLESESFKPLRLHDGRLIATGYVFERPDMLTPIVDPVTQAVLPLGNRVAWSNDGGQSWTVPRGFSVDGAPLELSGPPIEAADGRILVAAGLFHLGPTGHEGWLIESTDGGENWRRRSVFYRAPQGNVAAWESRIVEVAPGRLAVVFWAHDLAAGRNLDTHLVLSDDGGQTFGAPLATGILAQASGLLALGDGRLLLLQCHREPPVSLTLREIALPPGGGVRVLDTCAVFSEAAMGVTGSTATAQFASLKFGQPALVRLSGDEILAAWWQVEACQHVIKGARISLGRGGD